MSESKKSVSPKSPRYFYTDPLAAAWMAKHFGMRFNNAFWHQHLDCSEGITDMYELTKGPLIGMFNVHPNSRHLLEPQDIDLNLCVSTDCQGLPWGWAKERGFEWETRPSDAQIIRRGGKPFFWPEQEVV